MALTMCLHAFSDLTHVSPAVFLYLLEDCFIRGSRKATERFRALQEHVSRALYNSPQPGPATFIVHCLHITHSRWFRNLLLSALRSFLEHAPPSYDTIRAKSLAAQFFIEITEASTNERIPGRILEVFDVKMADIEEAKLRFNSDNFESAKTLVERYILGLVESESYMTAVSLLEHFSLCESQESLLLKMMEKGGFKAVEKWVTFMGKPMLRILVQEYYDRNMIKKACETMKEHKLQEEFPEVYRKCKESSVKNLAEKASWDLAEAKANGDRQLLEYLVFLAMEAGYSEKVDELVDRYSLQGFSKGNELKAILPHGKFLQFNDLVVGEVVWVDEANALYDAICSIEGCKIAGLDFEYKPNYVEGSEPNKVCIMQIATGKRAFIFDLIKLFEEVPCLLDDCLTRIFQSPRILKLGYNIKWDIKMLVQSYGELKCFKRYEMLLDMRSLFKGSRGGLSGHAKELLGAGLDKTVQVSNWEERPLSTNQMEYAALDAIVLVRMFHPIRNHPNPRTEGHGKIEWSSRIISYTHKPKKEKEDRNDTKASNDFSQ